MNEADKVAAGQAAPHIEWEAHEGIGLEPIASTALAESRPPSSDLLEAAKDVEHA